MPDEHSWPEVLAALLRGDHLTRDEARWSMDRVMSGEATPAQVAALVVALRAKGEDADEVVGLVDAMLAHAVDISVPQPALDIVGTGGDQSHSVNLSTMSALVAAAAGARVVKHGNRAATSRCGSADVLEALGVDIEMPPESVAACVEQVGIGFCFAPLFHPAMRHAAVARSEIGVPTVFNVLGPLANPASPTASLVGCADARLAPVMARVLRARDQHALVVRGDDGLDEVTTATTTRVWDATGESLREDVIDARALGLAVPPADSLRGGDAQFNAAVARAVLAGEQGPVADAVVLNAAAALVADAAARGGSADATVMERVARELPRARAAIESGAAQDLLQAWVAFAP